MPAGLPVKLSVLTAGYAKAVPHPRHASAQGDAEKFVIVEHETRFRDSSVICAVKEVMFDGLGPETARDRRRGQLEDGAAAMNLKSLHWRPVVGRRTPSGCRSSTFTRMASWPPSAGVSRPVGGRSRLHRTPAP